MEIVNGQYRRKYKNEEADKPQTKKRNYSTLTLRLSTRAIRNEEKEIYLESVIKCPTELMQLSLAL